MSEEACESRNKHVREYRMHHTRKDNRLHTMSDLFGFLLVSSDPIISSTRMYKRKSRAKKPLHPDARALLTQPDLVPEPQLDNSDED